MRRVVVALLGDGHTALKRIKIADDFVVVEDVRFVVIDVYAFLERQLRKALVVAILSDNDAAARKAVLNSLCKRALAAARCAADTHDNHNQFVPLRIFRYHCTAFPSRLQENLSVSAVFRRPIDIFAKLYYSYYI